LIVIHHVVNEHQWILSYGNDKTECSQGPLEDKEEMVEERK